MLSACKRCYRSFLRIDKCGGELRTLMMRRIQGAAALFHGLRSVPRAIEKYCRDVMNSVDGSALPLQHRLQKITAVSSILATSITLSAGYASVAGLQRPGPDVSNQSW
jgi:hypothetical protein